ncbi:MAG: thioredoxin family protein, partial [Anaerolineales bacterium]|nr:thioredoxin family protein [Anaerolineales bacterium]
LLNDDIKQQVREVFADLKEPVEILFFGQAEDCDYCDDTRQLVEEVGELSDSISVSTFDLNKDSDIAKKFNVDKAPGILIGGKNETHVIDYGIRYAGIPSGHEFSSLIQDILMVSSQDSGLSEAAREFLKNLDEPVHLQVFVTPTCPYCPRAVVLAHRLAFESPKVQAEMIEATEFPMLSSKFGVSGVPDTSINHGKSKVVGAVPEDHLLEEIKRVVSGS